jgi:hypothetical protein
MLNSAVFNTPHRRLHSGRCRVAQATWAISSGGKAACSSAGSLGVAEGEANANGSRSSPAHSNGGLRPLFGSSTIVGKDGLSCSGLGRGRDGPLRAAPA